MIFNSAFLKFFYEDTTINSVKSLWKIYENSKRKLSTIKSGFYVTCKLQDCMFCVMCSLKTKLVFIENFFIYYSVRSRTAATSKMERFVIIINGWKPLWYISAVNYYHKAPHLGCCNSPRSASALEIVNSVIHNVFKYFWKAWK